MWLSRYWSWSRNDSGTRALTPALSQREREPALILSLSPRESDQKVEGLGCELVLRANDGAKREQRRFLVAGCPWRRPLHTHPASYQSAREKAHSGKGLRTGPGTGSRWAACS